MPHSVSYSGPEMDYVPKNDLQIVIENAFQKVKDRFT